MNAVQQLEQLGQSVWYDNISRHLIRSGGLAKLVGQGLLGVTSNPTIFDKAISGSSDYDQQIRELLARRPVPSTAQLIQELMITDIQEACDVLRVVYDRTAGRDGYVSVEVTPTKARDTVATLDEARGLWRRISRKNLMIKIPATLEGLPAIRQATAEGMNINITLIFAVERYRAVAEAFLAGLEDRLTSGKPLNHVASVASVFVSRIDTLVDDLLAKKGSGSPLLGKCAVANTKMMYQAFREIFGSARFKGLQGKGGTIQRPLWGSTGTKNPSYSDLLYVETLVGPHTVNTVPPVTYDAILDHLDPALTIEQDVDGARAILRNLAAAGIDIRQVTDKLEADGVASFEKSFDGLYRNLEAKR
jgi:transaldolase / glucose-6-phosphate isomerase